MASNSSFNLGTVLTIGSMVVSVVSAWGMFGTRLAVLEQKVVQLSDSVTDLKAATKEQGDKTDRLENRIRDSEAAMGDLYIRLNAKK